MRTTWDRGLERPAHAHGPQPAVPPFRCPGPPAGAGVGGQTNARLGRPPRHSWAGCRARGRRDKGGRGPVGFVRRGTELGATGPGPDPAPRDALHPNLQIRSGLRTPGPSAPGTPLHSRPPHLPTASPTCRVYPNPRPHPQPGTRIPGTRNLQDRSPLSPNAWIPASLTPDLSRTPSPPRPFPDAPGSPDPRAPAPPDPLPAPGSLGPRLAEACGLTPHEQQQQDQGGPSPQRHVERS